MEPEVAAANALENVLEVKPGETILIIADDVRQDIGEVFAKGAIKLGLWTRLLILKTEIDVFRKNVPPHLIEMITTSPQPDIFINILRGPSDETPFRIQITELETRKRSARLGHCPGITMDMLTEGALSLTREDHAQMQAQARKLISLLQHVDSVEVSATSGSKFSLGVKDRTWFSDTYIDWKQMKWMNLPTGEVLVGPIETSMNGMLVCDVAIGGIGPIKSPLTLEVKAGRVQTIKGEDSKIIEKVKQTQSIDDMAKYVGEFAFGLNPKARIVQEFLETEKIGNAVHVAFGSNIDYPGVVANHSKTHQDFLINKPTVIIHYDNGTLRMIMQDGKLLL
jgi:leucyl aminopeptidase (aminopeptidase T)